MLRQLLKIQRTGIVTGIPERDGDFELAGAALRRSVARRFGGSLAIRQVDAGSCNGCELEIHALSNAIYAIERFGVHLVASPRHADLLLVTGPVSRHMEEALRRTWQAMAEPRLVLAAGTCAADGGEFGESYASRGAVANVVPVDGVIRGCPPTPLDPRPCGERRSAAGALRRARLRSSVFR